jgi:hypothetical protein
MSSSGNAACSICRGFAAAAQPESIPTPTKQSDTRPQLAGGTEQQDGLQQPQSQQPQLVMANGQVGLFHI